MLSTTSTAVGQTVSKPSVPQFSVRIIGNYYYVPPTTTTTIDQYTGKEITITTPGYYKDEREVEVSIKNQPFKPYTDVNGKKYSLYYHVQRKGHFGDDWQTFWASTFQSDSDYTILLDIYPYYLPLPGEAQLDFRVEAIVGQPVYWFDRYVYYEGGGQPQFFKDVVSSGWGEVLTFTVLEPGVASTLPPTQTTISPPSATNDGDGLGPSQLPDQTYPPWSVFTHPLFLLGGGILFGGVIVAVVMTLLRRQQKTKLDQTSIF